MSICRLYPARCIPDCNCSAVPDGASSFGKNFKTAYYPKVSLSWLVSNTGFFPTSRVLSSLRYRLAWGASGVTPSSTAALAQNSLSTVFLNGTTVSGAKLQALGNPNLKPERTEEIETGLDAIQPFVDAIKLSLDEPRE